MKLMQVKDDLYIFWYEATKGTISNLLVYFQGAVSESWLFYGVYPDTIHDIYQVGLMYLFLIVYFQGAVSESWLFYGVYPDTIQDIYHMGLMYLFLIVYFQGAVSESWLFYGVYPDTIHDSYHVGLMYLFLIVLTYFGSLFIILKRYSLYRVTSHWDGTHAGIEKGCSGCAPSKIPKASIIFQRSFVVHRKKNISMISSH